MEVRYRVLDPDDLGESEATALRIGMFTNSYKPYTSGVVRSLETFKHHLEQLGHQVYVFAPGYGTGPEDETVFRYHAVPAPTARGYYLPIPLSWRTKRRVRELQLDIIHVHAPFLLGRLGLITGRQLGIPVVFTYHTRYDLYTHYAPLVGRSLKTVVGGITTRFSNRCDAIIAPTPSIRAFLQSKGVTTPIWVVPTGVEPLEFQAHDARWAQAEYGLRPAEQVIITIGRLGKEKNLGFLLEVMTHLPEQVRLVIVGDGPLRPRLERQVERLNLRERVVFTGQLERSKVASALHAAQVFVFSSTTDTQGVVLLEARLADLPIVALTAPGAQDLIHHGEDGYLIDESSPAAFAEATQRLLQDRTLRQRMSNQGREQVQQYSAEACAQRLVEVYATTLARTPRHA